MRGPLSRLHRDALLIAGQLATYTRTRASDRLGGVLAFWALSEAAPDIASDEDLELRWLLADAGGERVPAHILVDVGLADDDGTLGWRARLPSVTP